MTEPAPGVISPPSRRRALIAILLYFGLIELGNFFYLDSYNVSVFWPASGMAAAACLLVPWDCWRKLIPSLIAVNLLSNLLLHDRGALPTVIFTLSNVAEPVIIACLIRAWTEKTGLPWSSPKKLLLAGLAAHIGAGAGALIGAWGWLTPAAAFWPVWQRWFAADILGVLLVTPLILAWSTFSLSRIREATFMHAAEAAALFALLAFFIWEAFAYPHLPTTPFHDGPHFVIIFLLWAALRFNVRVTAAAALMMALIAVWQMKSGAWPRALESLQGGARVFYLQSFLFVYSGSMLVLAAIQEGLRAREQALRETEARFRGIFDISPLSIGISDDKGIILQANPAFEKMLGCEPGGMLGMRTSEITHPDDRPDMARYYQELHAAKDGITRVRKRYLRTDGATIDAELRMLVLPQSEGKPPLRLALVEDVTERNRAVAGRIAAGVAHEINNPINIILGLAEVIMLERRIAKQTRRDLEAIVVHAKRAGAITRGLLHIGRKIQPSPQAFPVQELIDTTRQLLRQELKRGGAALAADMEENPVLAFADPDQIQQVLLNIVLNANDAMKDSSFKRITVHLEETPDTVKVEIGDTGPGVSVKNSQNIFEPFFTTKTPNVSTGMGLAISRGIAEKNGGSLVLANPGEEGARFVLALPKPHRA